jgi:hypothetical protein
LPLVCSKNEEHEEDVKSFLSVARYYRQFIEGSSSMARLMTTLLEEDAKVVWTSDRPAAFEEIE